MCARLSRPFFARDTRSVARELLGMRLVHLDPAAGRLSGIIVETEAYCPNDAASHAFRGQTARNTPMFGVAGMAYIYFIYGMHFCFNIVTDLATVPAAVLIRALEPREGIPAMSLGRIDGKTKPHAIRGLCRGPARLCKSLWIDRALNGYDLCQTDSLMYVEEEAPVADTEVACTPRIRVRGGSEALDACWRWIIKESPYLSK